MGDTPGSPHGMTGFGGDSIVTGYLPDGKGGDRWFGEWGFHGSLGRENGDSEWPISSAGRGCSPRWRP